MGDFGYRPANIRLLDGQLTLDPTTVSLIAEIEARMATRRTLQDMLRPNWNLVLPDFQSIISSPRPNIFSSPLPSTGSPSAPPMGAGPTTPMQANCPMLRE